MPWHQHRQVSVEFSFASEVSPDRYEQLVWSDSDSTLTISTISFGSDGFRYRLRPGQWMYVDVVTDQKFVARARTGIPQNNCDHFLADQVIPRVIAENGSLVVHAGAVMVGSNAVMFIGQSGRGKSTLSASFETVGAQLLGDDAIVVSHFDDQPQVEAVYPSLRLLPDSIAALLPERTATISVADYSEKRRITVNEAFPSPLPLRAAFVLSPPSNKPTITLRKLSVAETCMTFVANSFSLDPSDPTRARKRMFVAADLAHRVPTFKITYPRDYARLPEVRQAILDQIALLEAA